MRRYWLITLLGITLVALPALALRSEKVALSVAQWSVATFTDMELRLVNPTIQLYKGIVQADELHLAYKGAGGPPLVSTLELSADLSFLDLFSTNLANSSATARAVMVYVSETDDAEDPTPYEWLQYIYWLPSRVSIGTIHIISADDRTRVLPLINLQGARTETARFAATAETLYRGESLAASLVVDAYSSDKHITGIDLQCSFVASKSGSKINLDGELRGTQSQFEYDFKLDSWYRDIGFFLQDYKGGSRLEGSLELSGSMSGDLSGYELTDVHLVLNNLPAYGIEAWGSMSFTAPAETQLALNGAGEINTHDLIREWFDFDTAGFGKTELNLDLSGSLDRPMIDDFVVRTQNDSGLTVTVSGRLDPASLQPGVGVGDNEVYVDASAPALAALEPWLGTLPYEPGPWLASSRITGDEDTFILDRLIIEMGSPDSYGLRVTGSVGNVRHAGDRQLAGIEDISISASFEAADASVLSPIFHLDLPRHHNLAANWKAQGDGDRIQITDGEIHLESSDLNMTASGVTALLLPAEQQPVTRFVAPFTLELSDTSALSQYVHHEVPALGAVRLQGRLVRPETHLQVQELEAEISGSEFTLKSSGEIGDLHNLSGIDLHNEIGDIDTKHLLQALLDDFRYNKPIDGLRGSFHLTGSAEAWHVNNLNLHSTRESGPLEVHARGSIHNVDHLANAELKASIHLRDPELLQQLSGLPASPTSGDLLVRSAPQALSLTAKARTGSTQWTTDGVIKHRGQTIQGINFALDIPHLHLADLGLGVQASGQGEPPAVAPGAPQPDPEEEFYLAIEELPQYPVEAAITVGQITGDNTDIHDLDILISGRDRRFLLSRLNARYTGDTRGEFSGVVDFNWRPPMVSVGGRALSMPLNALAKDIGYQADITGKLSVLAGITTAGTGTRTLLHNLRGKLALALHDGTIAGAAYDVLATDFLAWIYSGASRQKSTVIDCAIASFDLHDGIAESDNLYIETARMVAKGSAKFNFKREKLDISITPRSKSRKLQVPSAVRISGDFDDPRPDVSPIAAAADLYTEFITLVPRIARNIFHIDPKHGKHASPCGVQ